MPNGTVTFKGNVTTTVKVVAGSVKGKPTFWLYVNGERQLRAYRTQHGAEYAARERLGLAHPEDWNREQTA